MKPNDINDILDTHNINPIELSLDWPAALAELLTNVIFTNEPSNNQYLTEA